MKKILPIIIVILVIIGSGVVWKLTNKEAPELVVKNFEDCVKAGNPVMESYPRQCKAGNKNFVEYVGNELDKADLIRLDFPRPNQVIESPLIVRGEARGYWFFEASFPVVLTNWDGLIIAEGIATAKSEWMTEDFVPFEAKLIFTVDKDAYSNKGTLILRKDNPSGLTEHDDALEIPVVFKVVDESNNTGILPIKSGVSGTVLLGPTCPVMRDPPDPACADRPYQTTIQVIAVGSPKSSPFTSVKTDEEGKYKVLLPPGEYALQPTGGSVMPRCETKNITITSDTMIEVNLSCDSGIR